MKKKLSLQDLKIQSFVTSVNKNINGGAPTGTTNVPNTVKDKCNVSDQVWSLCQTCGIYC